MSNFVRISTALIRRDMILFAYQVDDNEEVGIEITLRDESALEVEASLDEFEAALNGTPRPLRAGEVSQNPLGAYGTVVTS